MGPERFELSSYWLKARWSTIDLRTRYSQSKLYVLEGRTSLTLFQERLDRDDYLYSHIKFSGTTLLQPRDLQIRQLLRPGSTRLVAQCEHLPINLAALRRAFIYAT